MNICTVMNCDGKLSAKGLCQKHYNKQYRTDNKQYIKNLYDAWHIKNPKYKQEYDKQYYSSTKKERTLLQKYGISLQQYNEILIKQDGKCAICRSSTPGSRHTYFTVDHNHQSGATRGLLCSVCNKGIGHFKDSQGLLRQAIEYLKTYE